MRFIFCLPETVRFAFPAGTLLRGSTVSAARRRRKITKIKPPLRSTLGTLGKSFHLQYDAVGYVPNPFHDSFAQSVSLIPECSKLSFASFSAWSWKLDSKFFFFLFLFVSLVFHQCCASVWLLRKFFRERKMVKLRTWCWVSNFVLVVVGTIAATLRLFSWNFWIFFSLNPALIRITGWWLDSAYKYVTNFKTWVSLFFLSKSLFVLGLIPELLES